MCLGHLRIWPGLLKRQRHGASWLVAARRRRPGHTRSPRFETRGGSKWQIGEQASEQQGPKNDDRAHHGGNCPFCSRRGRKINPAAPPLLLRLRRGTAGGGAP